MTGATASSMFMPHGHCYLWQPEVLWLNAIADGVVALAYAVIPILLIVFARRRKDLAFHWVFLMFGVFILACGASHVMEIVTIWYPAYWLGGGIKVVTAVASVGTAWAIWPLLPKALAMPNQAQLAAANQALEKRARQQSALAKVTQCALLRVDTAELVEASLEQVHMMLAAEKSALLFMDRDTKRLCFKAGRGWSGEETEAFDLTAESSAHILGRSESQVPAQIAGYGEPAAHPSYEFSALIHGQKYPVGALIIFASKPWQLSEDEVNFLQALANVLGIAHEREQNDAVMLELTRSNTELERFSYIASHDLQEPLRKISSFCQLLHADYAPKLEGDGRMYMDYILDGVKRMQTLIEDVLDYSRLGTRQSPKTVVALTDVVQEAISNLDLQVRAAGAEVTFDTLPMMRGDHSSLVRLMQNLISNAVKYRGDKPPSIRISCRKKPHEWVIGVHDNGIGIPPAHLEKIFEIFRRLHGRGKYPGTGIGLAVCRKVVEQWGGTIWAESTGKDGSVFYFSVPREVDLPDLPAID